jgi:hypothetical protein
MYDKILLPHRFKAIGLVLFLPSLGLGLLIMLTDLEFAFLDANVLSLYYHPFMGEASWFKMVKNNLTNEIVAVALILAGLMVGFSKEKQEDEYIASLRLRALQEALWINYAVLLLAMVAIYEQLFFQVMVINLFTPLLFFIVRFQWALHQMRRHHEE